MATSRALPDLKARLKIDTGDAPKATTSVQQLARSLRTELATSAATSVQSLDKVRSRLDAMIVDLEKTGRGSTDAAKQLRVMKERVDQQAAALGVAGTATDKGTEKVREHVGAQVAVGAATEKTTGLFGKFQAKLEGMGPVGARFSKSLEGLGVTESVFAGGLIGIGAAAGVASIKLGLDLAHAASDLNEQMGRTGVVFGTASGQIIKFAEVADRNLGLSETAALSAASAFGGMFHNAGLSDQATARMSTTLVGLSGDLASFMNIQGGSADAADKLTMGLTGQLDVLRELGIFISDVDVVNEAMRLGLAKTATQVTESDKIVARYNLILAQTSQAQGDFARTSDGAANSERQVGAQFDNLKTTIGTGLLPVLKLWLFGMGQTVRGMQMAVQGAAALNEALRNIPLGQTIKNFEDWGGQLLNFIGRQQRAGTAATDYGTAQAKASDKIKQATQAQKEQNEALQKAHDLLLGEFNQALAYQSSQLATRDAIGAATQAQKDLNDATRGYGPNSAQAKAAQEDLDKAQIAVYQSALAQAQAAEDLHRKWVEEAGGTYTAQQATQDQIVALQQVEATLAPGNPLRARLDEYIAKLKNEIPREIQTHFNVIFTSEGAISAGGSTDIFIPRASGGSLIPGHAYTIGEHGPERVVMGAGGGMVLPGGSGPVEVSNLSTRRIERLLAQQNDLLARALAQPTPSFNNHAYSPV